MAGTDRMYDALFRQCGVLRALDFADLLDMPAALATRRRLAGRRVAILTSTGGAGTLVADSLGLAGFETPAPDASTAAALRALQQGDQAALDRNPIDVTLAGLQPGLLRGAIRILLASASYDAVAVVVGSSALAMPDLMAGALQDCLPESDKPLLAYVSPHAPHIARLLTERGVPAFTAPESCTTALRALLQASSAGKSTASVASLVASAEPPVDLSGLPIGSLDEAEAKQLFARFGVPSVRERVVTTALEAADAAVKLESKVVLKLLSREITHKSDVGGVAVGLRAEDIGQRPASHARPGARRHRPRAPGLPGAGDGGPAAPS